MKFFSNVSNKFLTTSHSVLLLLVIFTIFIIPFFPMEWHRIFYSICFTLIFLLSALALSKDRSKVFNIAIAVILIEWFSELLNLSVLITISFLANILFFDLIVVLFILQISRAKTVTPQVIMESINGYLLLGMSFSILIALVCVIDPDAFSFKHLVEQMNPGISYVSNYIYFGFVTLSTLGYGDIVPLTPAARSLSIFTSMTGQMYVAIIIAALVSKYLGQKSSNI
ncbi:MAG: ion channel [Ignavibacteriaceae bacterium]